jgi:c-di-GMP-binding flagellar brake protein YcgR
MVMTERRKYPRIEALQPVLYYSNTYPSPKVASTLDLSLGGARIETRTSIRKREGLDIAIAIQPRVIRCRGKVMYVIDSNGERMRAGIRFEDLSQDDFLSLGEYLSSMTSEQAPIV